MRQKGGPALCKGAYGTYGTKTSVNDDYFPTSILQVSNADQSGKEHPTQKPVPLMAYLIRTYTNPGETVLDSCMGSGTTGVGRVQTGRNFIGIEKDAGYFAIAERRLRDAQQPLFGGTD